MKKKSPKAVLGMHPWQDRHFVLYPDRLVYKKDVDDADEAGEIPLVTITIGMGLLCVGSVCVVLFVCFFVSLFVCLFVCVKWLGFFSCSSSTCGSIF